MSDTVKWLSHDFRVYDYYRLWPDIGGDYLFTKFDPFVGWSPPFYVGETHSFQERLTPMYENWNQAVALGATHVHVMVAPAVLREAIEAELIQAYKPVLNKQQPSIPFPFRSGSYRLPPWE